MTNLGILIEVNALFCEDCLCCFTCIYESEYFVEIPICPICGGCIYFFTSEYDVSHYLQKKRIRDNKYA